MRNLLKYFGIAVLSLGLIACDNTNDDLKARNNPTQGSASAVSLMDGKLSFNLPEGITDKSGKLGTQTNNMHVYADKTGQRAIIIIEDAASREELSVLSQRLEQQQRNRDPQLQVVSNKAVTISGHQAQQLDTVISANQQTAWSTILLVRVNEKLVTLQITLPADDQQQAQSDASKLVSSLKLQ